MTDPTPSSTNKKLSSLFRRRSSSLRSPSPSPSPALPVPTLAVPNGYTVDTGSSRSSIVVVGTPSREGSVGEQSGGLGHGFPSSDNIDVDGMKRKSSISTSKSRSRISSLLRKSPSPSPSPSSSLSVAAPNGTTSRSPSISSLPPSTSITNSLSSMADSGREKRKPPPARSSGSGGAKRVGGATGLIIPDPAVGGQQFPSPTSPSAEEGGDSESTKKKKKFGLLTNLGRKISERKRSQSSSSLSSTYAASPSATPLSNSVLSSGTFVTEPEGLPNGVAQKELASPLSFPVLLGSMTPSSAPATPVTPSPVTTMATAAVQNTAEDEAQPTPRPPTGEPRTRSASMYSEWSYDFDADSESEEEVWGTPVGGLSEVEEGDEDDDAVSLTGAPEVGEVKEGKTEGDGQGDGQVQRALITSTTEVPATPVRATQHPTSKVDQAASLYPDIASCVTIITLFLTSRMRAAEALVAEQDPDNQHMYLQNAAAIIQGIKGMMTFDASDLTIALEIAKGTSGLAYGLRKPQSGLLGKLVGGGVKHVKGMGNLERHAELVYAESLLIKAVLGIVAGGDWVGLVKEALNMRTANGIYKTLQTFLEQAEADGTAKNLDEHFKSGVELGNGISALMLSLLPGKVLRIAEMLGYAGDRQTALSTLMKAGGWSSDPKQLLPAIGGEGEGVRRPVCDMVLLVFHLVISVLIFPRRTRSGEGIRDLADDDFVTHRPVSGVDIPLAKKILDWNLKRYPDGIFFLYFQSRLHTTQAQPELATATLQRALDLKLEYLQLQHMCLWDMGVNSLMLCNFKKSRSCSQILKAESNWSKAVYLYSEAACSIELMADGDKSVTLAQIVETMTEVPKSTRRIAGKSLPIEKFVSRKARKFLGQNNRLILPAIEIGYFFGALPNTPPRLLYSTTIPRVEAYLAKLEATTPEEYCDGQGYWDDFCLLHFLNGVAHSFASYPHLEAEITEEEASSYPISTADSAAKSEASFKLVLQHGVEIQLDHWVVYHTHYELGRLYSQMGDNTRARHHLELVLSGRVTEVAPQHSKGKYSLESALQLKAHAGLQTCKESATSKMH